MTRRSTLAQTFAMLFAIVQLLLHPVAAWADADFQREASARAVDAIHVEAHTSNGCPLAHPATCALCHAASITFVQPAPSAFLLARHIVVARKPITSRAVDGRADEACDARPRAPPTLI